MASEYSVNIRLNTEQVRKDLKDIKTDIDKLGKVNLGTNRRTQRTEAQITKSKDAQKAAMVETRRIGDLVQKAADQGLKVDKARSAINKAALADGRSEFKLSKAQHKVALEELKTQRAITKEKGQQARLSQSIGRQIASPIGGTRTMMGSPTQLGFAGTGMGRSSLRGNRFQFGSPAFFEAGARAGGASSPLLGTRFDFGSPAQRAFSGGPSLPIGGSRFTPGSPAFFDAAARAGGQRSPIGGSRFTFGSPAFNAAQGVGAPRVPIGGRADLVGSPANILRVAKENAMPVKGFESLVGSPAYFEAQNKQILQVAKDNALPVRGFKNLPGSPAYFEAQNKDILKVAKQNAIPVQGFKNLVGSPAYFKAQADEAERLNREMRPRGDFSALSSRQSFNARGQRTFANNPLSLLMGGRGFDRGSAFSSAAISGAFPLLFGQGPLAAAGGAIGGGLGGGLGGQMGGFAGGLIGTAVVSGITGFVNSVTELGRSIETLDGQFNLLTQKSLFSTKEAENRAKVLQSLGEREKLATLLSQELTAVLGQDGAEKLRRAGEASKELNKTFAELTINLQLALAGPISNFLKLVNQVLNQGTAISLGQGKGTVNLGPGEKQFLKDFGGVLSSMSQSQIDNILRAQIGTNVEGLQITNERRQAIRKFDLARQTNPAGLDAFMGGGSSFAGGNTPLEVDAKRVASAQKKVKTMQKEVEFSKLVVEEGLKEADIQKQIQSITKNLNEEELKLLDTQGLSVRALVEKNNQAKQLVENARMIEQSFKSLTQNISTDLAQGIQGLIRGTSTLNDVLNNVLNKMIDAAFNMAFFGNASGTLTKGLGLFGSLFSGFLANGGPAKAGRSYIVGEKGPELFTPGVSGMVTPNSQMGVSTNIVVNVDASGSNVEGDEEEGRQLGIALSAAIESELIKQKRPGGLLA